MAGFTNAPDHCDVAGPARLHLCRHLRQIQTISAAQRIAFGVFVDHELVDAGVDDSHLHIGMLIQKIHVLQPAITLSDQVVVAGGRIADQARPCLPDAVSDFHAVIERRLARQIEI